MARKIVQMFAYPVLVHTYTTRNPTGWWVVSTIPYDDPEQEDRMFLSASGVLLGRIDLTNEMMVAHTAPSLAILSRSITDARLPIRIVNLSQMGL